MDMFGALLTAALAGLGQSPPPPPALSLAEAVRTAIEQGMLAPDAADALLDARAELFLVKAQLAPQIGVDALGSFGQSSAPNQSYGVRFDQKLATGTSLKAAVSVISDQNQLGAYYTGMTAMSLTQPLLRGFGGRAIRRDVDRAEDRVEDAERRGQIIERQVALQVAEAYFRLASQTTLIGVADDAVRQARILVEASEAKLSVGTVSRHDLLRARQLLLQAELQSADARSAADDARDALRLLMGREDSFDFRVNADLPQADKDMPLAQAIDLAARVRPELLLARAAVVEGERAVASSTDLGRPQFDVTFDWRQTNVTRSFSRAFGQTPFQFGAFAGVSVPINRREAEVALGAALRRLARDRRNLTFVRLQVDAEVRSAHRQLIRWAGVLAQTDLGVTLANEDVDLARLRYQRGLSNNLDVVNAESALLAARARQLSARADLALARLRFRVVTGTLDPKVDLN